MICTENDPSIIVTSGGTFCVLDAHGDLIGTITLPIERKPLGAGREKVYLNRVARATDSAAA
ncbi:MAG: hypothetical protein O2973_07205 [Gemmatimonadetes bacterium]|nr:hypothetical protein [Gemmatimonadota bacterium]